MSLLLRIAASNISWRVTQCTHGTSSYLNTIIMRVQKLYIAITRERFDIFTYLIGPNSAGFNSATFCQCGGNYVRRNKGPAAIKSGGIWARVFIIYYLYYIGTVCCIQNIILLKCWLSKTVKLFLKYHNRINYYLSMSNHPNYPIISIILKTKGLTKKVHCTKFFSSSKYTL